MAGLVPAIHVFAAEVRKTWMPGTRPGMTKVAILATYRYDICMNANEQLQLCKCWFP